MVQAGDVRFFLLAGGAGGGPGLRPDAVPDGRASAPGPNGSAGALPPAAGGGLPSPGGSGIAG